MFDENGNWIGAGVTGGGVSPQFMSLSPYMGQGAVAAPVLGGAVNTATAAIARPDFLSWDGMLGTTNANGTKSNGWGGAALGLIQGLGSAYMGMKQYGLAKEQLQFSKDAFNKNYAAQRQTMNTQLEDRQRARVAANPGAYQSVGDYMTKNGIQ